MSSGSSEGSCCCGGSTDECRCLGVSEQGGIPGCGRFEETTELFKSNPEIKYVWIPVFVTNRQQTRHKCFSEKIAALDQKDYFKGTQYGARANQDPRLEYN